MTETIDPETQEFRYALGLRIDQVVKKVGKKSSAAEAAGVTPDQLNKWIKGAVKVPVDGLRSLARLANADFSWLASGEGSMFQGSSGATPVQAGGLTDLDQPGFVRLPFFDEVRAAAGPGQIPVSEMAGGVVAFERSFLRDRGARPESCALIWAHGDSMKPTIPDGSILVIDRSQREVEHGCIYVFNVADRLLVKRARWRMDGRLELVSDNANEYPVETFGSEAVDELRVVGRVVYFCRAP